MSPAPTSPSYSTLILPSLSRQKLCKMNIKTIKGVMKQVLSKSMELEEHLQSISV